MTERNNQRGQGRLAGALARKSKVPAQPVAEPQARQQTDDTSLEYASSSTGGLSDGSPDSSGISREQTTSTGRGVRTTITAGRSGKSVSARRGGSTEYKQCLAYVRREVRDRVEQARTDPEVRAGLVTDLRERGIRFKPDNPEYSALIELLLLEWLDAVDYAPVER